MIMQLNLREIAIALFQADVSQTDIAAELGISQPTVSRWIARHKAKASRKGVCPCCGRKLPPSDPKPSLESTDAA